MTTPRTDWTPDALIGLFDHAILHPTATDAAMRAELLRLRVYPVASVCIKPYAIRLAVEVLAGTKIGVGTVIGFPHGSATPEVKAAETRQAIADGAREVDMVVNVGKALSGDWEYLRRDIGAVAEAAHASGGGGAIVKVIFETDYLPEDATKVRLCQVCGEAGADFVKTSTGFGYVKRPDGNFNYVGATPHDIELMKRSSKPGMGIKPSGGVRTLDDVLKYVAMGATRIGTASTFAIYEEAVKRFGGVSRETGAAKGAGY